MEKPKSDPEEKSILSLGTQSSIPQLLEQLDELESCKNEHHWEMTFNPRSEYSCNADDSMKYSNNIIE